MRIFNLAYLILTISFSIANADIPLPLDMQKKVEQEWQEAKCKDPMNLITCHYANPDPKHECTAYRGKSAEYKMMARKGGATVGYEKYCHLVGKDKN